MGITDVVDHQAQLRAQLLDNARTAALARLTPERRAIAEHRIAEAAVAQKVEQERLAALTPDERRAEMAAHLAKSAATKIGG